MNIQTAIALIQTGSRVKLPEWTGYWFISKDKQTSVPMVTDETYKDIKAFCKNGDIGTDPVWIERYKDRDDFEVTEGNLGYDFAILALKNGKMVTRIGWGGKNIYVKMQVPDQHSKMTRPYLYITVMPLQSLQFGEERFHELNRMPYTPNQTDMLSEDWILYEGEHAEGDGK